VTSPSTRVRVGLWVLLVAAVVGQGLVRPSPDVSWLLYVAREMLHGARLGVDLLEVTPPMIFLPKLPVVWVAGFVGVGMWHAWIGAMVVLAFGTLFLIQRMLLPGRAAGESQNDFFVLATAFLLLLLPSVEFGQKEHLTAVLVLPYVVLAARRLARAPVSMWLAVVAGVMGGVAIGIKPHFVLLMMGILVLEYWRLGGRLPWVEHLSVILVGVIYLILVAILIPGYYAYARDYGGLYQTFLSRTALEIIVFGHGSLPGLIALGIFAVLRQYVPQWRRPLADALAVGTAAFYLAAVLQGKGWYYHFLPSIILGSLLLGLLLAAGARRLPTLHRVYHALGAAVLIATIVAPLPATMWRLLRPSSSVHDADPNFSRLVPVIRGAGAGATVAVLSSNIASAFPLVLQAGARWPLRFPSLWPLIALYADSLDWRHVTVPRAYEARGPFEHSFVDDVIEDLESGNPALVLVLQPDVNAIGWGGARHFDYLEYFSTDPEFKQFFEGYTSIGSAGNYDVYRRRTEGQTSSTAVPPSSNAPPRHRLPLALLAWILTGFWAGLGCMWSWRVTGARGGGCPRAPPGRRLKRTAVLSRCQVPQAGSRSSSAASDPSLPTSTRSTP